MPRAAPVAVEYLCAGQSQHPTASPLCALQPFKMLIFASVPDCASSNEIKAREPIRCRECGCRMMYKKRIKRSKSKAERRAELVVMSRLWKAAVPRRRTVQEQAADQSRFAYLATPCALSYLLLVLLQW